MFLLWLWCIMPWIGAVVMARLCWRVMTYIAFFILFRALVVALAEQNAIDLVRAVVASSHTCKETFRGIAAEGQTEAQ